MIKHKCDQSRENINTLRANSAFTIIEVVLVLAIAGLIFLMVFIALPALQRSQRDAQRKRDVVRLAAAIRSFQSNNRRQLPSDIISTTITNYVWIESSAFGQQYLEGEFRSPEGDRYAMYSNRYNLPGDNIPSVFLRDLFAAIGMRCQGEALVEVGGSNRAAIRGKLESGGIYCVDV